MIDHHRGDNGSIIAAVIHYHNRYVDATAAIFNAAINFLPSRKWTIIKRDLMRTIVSIILVAQEIFCMKKIATLFIADCTDGTKEKRNLSPRIVRVKNINSNSYMARYTFISWLLNDYVPVLGVFE